MIMRIKDYKLESYSVEPNETAHRCFKFNQSLFCYKMYRKNSKIWDTSNNCHNCPKNSKV